MKNNYWQILGRLATAMALIISLIALASTAPRVGLAIDYLGVLVAIMAVIVTLLVGWQIYNTIDIRNRVDGLERKSSSIARRETESLNHTIRGYVIYLSAFDSYNKGQYDLALQGAITAIGEAKQGKDVLPIEISIALALGISNKWENPKIPKEQAREYILTLSDIEPERIDLVREYIIKITSHE